MRSVRQLAAVALVALSASGAFAQQAPEPAVRTWFEAAQASAAESDFILDGDVQPAALFQPALSQPTAGQPRMPARRAPGSQQANIRLASVPNMFGDFAMVSGVARVFGQDANGQATLTNSSFGIPTAGSIRTGKISENDTPIPVDRVFFSYNHFNNLFQVNEQPIFPPGSPGIMRQEPLDRYTIGAEKTFLDGLYSVEVRMPFNGTYDVNLQTFGLDGGNIGNLAVVLKSLLYSDANLAVGAGMAIDTPTGSDTVTRFGSQNLRINNESVHFLPYIGFIYSPGDPTWGWGNGLFLTGFGQVDITASGNPVQVGAVNGPPGTTIGKFTDQNLLFLDLGIGYWLYRNPDAERLTGLSAVTEFHYTTSLQDTDVLGAPGPMGSNIVLRNPFNRFDIVNFTVGIQALLFDASSLRVAYAFPLGTRADQRFFDSEVQVQFNRRF